MPARQSRIAHLEGQIATEDFWKDDLRSRETIRELKSHKAIVEPFAKLENDFFALKEIVGLVTPDDTDSLIHFREDLGRLKRTIDGLEFKSLLGDEADHCNAILSVNAGAGGTESCDWAVMLLRMYTKWAEGKSFKMEILDQMQGEDAGIKNATILISGEYAYGFLKAESGVHRLVRISPFDANKRRHTSFVSVDVIPEVSDDIQIDVKEADLKIDTYRAGGKGGQHVNKTDSAVRITHVPSGIIVQCQSERSQFKNKSTAMKMLRGHLYERERQKKAKALENAYEAKKEIAWGSQIRSYVLHPYQMVKDHRTDCEVGNALGALDGDIDPFIEAYLKWIKGSKAKGSVSG